MRRILMMFFVLVACGAPAAHAEKRIALVIGNAAYQSTAELKNPKNDAIDMAAALRRLGFEVFEGRDLDKRSMERVIRQFGVKLSGADIAFFFYAGHGLAIGGQNYLVPIDARLASEGDADFEGLPLSLVLKQMEREAKTSIVLLDACRDNPLARNLARTMGTRSAQIGQGLTEVKTGVGTLIGFSTQPGNVATDGAGRNSPYAEALLRHMEVPGKDVSGVLIAVRNDVLKNTDGKQVPWEHTSLTGQVYFRLDGQQAPAATLPPPATNYDREIELSFWNSVKDSKSPAMLESYLERYPNGNFSALARVMIEQTKVAAVPPLFSVLPPDAKPALPDLAKDIQTELRRVGCYSGSIDGKWPGRTRGALAQFARVTSMDLKSEEPTLAALEALKGHTTRVCPLECGAGRVEMNGRCVAKAAPPSPRAKSRAAHQPMRPARKVGGTERPSGGGMCWSNDRRGSLVSCSTPGAGSKAY